MSELVSDRQTQNVDLERKIDAIATRYKQRKAEYVVAISLSLSLSLSHSLSHTHTYSLSVYHSLSLGVWECECVTDMIA
jgi:hypothetical protein